jgi:SAM-dependent methyltransferase
MLNKIKKLISKITKPVNNYDIISTTDAIIQKYKGDIDLSSSEPRDKLYTAAALFNNDMKVLEIGTRRLVETAPTHSRSAFPSIKNENYIMGDVIDGLDVDRVVDLHKLPSEWGNNFDCFIANAVFEHLERPWIAAKEIERVLKPGGICYVCTHQTFPIHGHPSDFFRFSDSALKLIFEDAGMNVVAVAYEHRAQIIPPKALVHEAIRDHWNAHWPSYILVHLFAEKK